jgi:hypothetical protein
VNRTFSLDVSEERKFYCLRREQNHNILTHVEKHIVTLVISIAHKSYLGCDAVASGAWIPSGEVENVCWCLSGGRL